MDAKKLSYSKFQELLNNLKKRLAPILGPAFFGVFMYLAWNYRTLIIEMFHQIGALQLLILILFLTTTVIFTVCPLVIFAQDKGYDFKFTDGYHSLNLSQLASMIPGGIWGYAGFAGMLWSRGITKTDSVTIIFSHTLVMLSSCAIVGFSGLITILGWGYAIIILLPLLLFLLGRNWMEKIRGKYYPESSSLPSTPAILKSLFLGILVWILTASCFAWLLYAGNGITVPFWTVVGAYTTGYLGGYIAFLAPSGLGIREGLVTLQLGTFMDVEKILATAISFRIVHTSIVWFNVLVSVILTSISGMKNAER